VALNALGYTLANRTGRHGEAYRLIRRALEREPKNAAIQDSYGWIFYRQGLLGEARSYLQLAWSQFPDPEIAAHLGEVMWKQGDHESARRLWADALEKNPASQSLKDTMSRFLPQLQGPPS
jgi:tetratricopeptide (TPR) repeat protein